MTASFNCRNLRCAIAESPAGVIVGHVRRYSPRVTHNLENNGKCAGANTGITVEYAAVGAPAARMTHDHGRPDGVRREDFAPREDNLFSIAIGNRATA
jgi:hypothetical protein